MTARSGWGASGCAAALLAGGMISGCDLLLVDDALPPTDLSVSFSLAEVEASEVQASLQFDNLLVRVEIQGIEPIQQVIDIEPGQEEVRVRLEIPLEAEQASAQVFLELRQGEDPHFVGNETVPLQKGAQHQVEVELVSAPNGTELEATPPYDDSEFRTVLFDPCDVGLENSTGIHDPVDGETLIHLEYDFVPPCLSPPGPSMARVFYEKESAVVLDHGTEVEVEVRYAVLEATGRAAEGTVDHGFGLSFDLTEQVRDDQGLPHISFPPVDGQPGGSQPNIVDVCTADAGAECQPSGPFSPGDHVIRFTGTVNCSTAQSPCALPDLRTFVHLSARPTAEPPASGTGTFHVDLRALVFRLANP